MQLCRLWIVLGLLSVAAGTAAVQAAVIYKWTDSDGIVHYSDQPVPGAEKIIVSAAPRSGFGSPTAATTAAAGPPRPKGPATGLNFEQLAITSPGKEETITGNQPVSVHLALQPDLKPTQTVAWTLNGTPLSQSPDATQFTLDDLPRGTYTLSATVMDQSGESKSAETVTFYVVRPSLLSPQHKG